MDRVESERLSLRPLTWEDLPFFTRIHADPEVARFLGTGLPRTEQETREWLEKTLHWNRTEALGHMGIVRRADKQLIGRCGLACFEFEIPGPEGGEPRCYLGRGSAPAGMPITHEIELGYTLGREAWGQGYATEAARLMRDYAFQRRGLARIISLIHPDNVRSIHVAERLGLKRQDRILAYDRPFWRFALTRDEWQAQEAGAGTSARR